MMNNERLIKEITEDCSELTSTTLNNLNQAQLLEIWSTDISWCEDEDQRDGMTAEEAINRAYYSTYEYVTGQI